MEFNKESFEKALKANKIVRYQKHFEAVVKSYLEVETEQCNIANVVGRSEQLKCQHQYMNAGSLQGGAMKKCLKCGDYVKAF